MRILATETKRQLQEQYPCTSLTTLTILYPKTDIGTADIVASFGITSKPVERTTEYYTCKYLKVRSV